MLLFFAENSMDRGALLFLIIQRKDIDTVLTNGEITMAVDFLLLLSFQKKNSRRRLGEYLKDTFREGNGFYIDEREVSSWYSDKGIHLAYGTSAEDDTPVLSWSDAARG